MEEGNGALLIADRELIVLGVFYPYFGNWTVLGLDKRWENSVDWTVVDVNRVGEGKRFRDFGLDRSTFVFWCALLLVFDTVISCVILSSMIISCSSSQRRKSARDRHPCLCVWHHWGFPFAFFRTFASLLQIRGLLQIRKFLSELCMQVEKVILWGSEICPSLFLLYWVIAEIVIRLDCQARKTLKTG